MKHTTDSDIAKIIENLEQLRRFTGKPSELWPGFIRGCTLLVGADLGILLVKNENSDSWKNYCVWPQEKWTGLRNSEPASRIEKVAESVLMEGFAWEDISEEALFGVRLDLGEDKRAGVALFYTKEKAKINRDEAMFRLRLVADIPFVYQIRRASEQAKNDVVRFVETLDLMVFLNEEKRYMATVMTFCNQVASRFGCSRVSLGWLKKGYIRIQAISHIEKFEKKMEAVQSLETVMEEAFDQNEEVVYPPPEDSHLVAKDHEAFAISQAVKHIISIPLRLEDGPVAVLTCERTDNPFLEKDVNALRLICDQAIRRLSDLKKDDRWFGAKIGDYIHENLSKLLGVEHTLAKSVGIIICALLALLIFGKWEYRIEAPFILKTDDLAYLPAPFDGYIDEVNVQVGDEVKENDFLLTLDTRELLLEEASVLADLSRYTGEAEKARAKNALAEMKIAQALKTQAEAKLNLIHYHLDNSRVGAPFSGVVVEGELKELQGAPVRKGDVLFKVARLEKIYAELDLDERDIHEVTTTQIGEIAFVSMPDRKFPIIIERIDPVAVSKEKGNIFPVRSTFTEKIETWWRPGMSGIAKVNIGKRNLLWIFTHRTVDFFRFLLWW